MSFSVSMRRTGITRKWSQAEITSWAPGADSCFTWTFPQRSFELPLVALQHWVAVVVAVRLLLSAVTLKVCCAWLGLPWLGLAYGVCLIKVQTQPELCACLNNANAKMLLAILVAAVFPFPCSLHPFPQPPFPIYAPLLFGKSLQAAHVCVARVCLFVCVCVNCAYGKCCCRVLGADTEPLRPKI